MMGIRFAAIALAIGFATLPLLADHPTKERGFRADSLYQFTELDTINLFNGSVNIMLPIGQAYPVSSGLSYSFVLRYAGNVWSEIEVAGGKEGEATKIHFKPRRDNAGFGWNLSFGELEEKVYPTGAGGSLSRLTYQSPDGADHAFFPTLHPGETAVTGIRYTRDGSYLKSTDLTATTKLVEFPDGTKHHYEFDPLTSSGSTNRWLLQYIYNAHSLFSAGLPSTSYVKFTYRPEPGGGNWHDRWTIQDSVGRTNYVYFRSPAPTWNSSAVVDRIELQAFNGVTAVYDLGYNNYTVDGTGTIIDGGATTVPRPCRFANDTASIEAHMLRRIRLTKGNPLSSSESFTTFDMTYDPGPANCTGTPLATGGLLSSLTLPTRAKYSWTYAAYSYAGAKPYDESVGVAQRIVYDRDAVDAKIVQYRKYEASQGMNVVKSVKVSGSSQTPPSGNVDSKIISYFQATSGETVGLPYTTNQTAGGRYLSSETFECNENSSAESCDASPQRRQYIKYEWDPFDTTCTGTYPCEVDRNRRVQAERTVYTSDGDRYADSERQTSTFDGLGHYRQTTLSGTFNSGNNRVEETNYIASPGSYPGSFSLPSTWLLERFDRKSTTEGTVTETSEYCFNPTNSRLERMRRLAGSAQGTNDVVTAYDFDGDGNVTSERTFGGDAQAVDLGALCSLSLGTDVYRIDHTYAYGTRASSEYRDQNGASLGFKSADYDIDMSTGFIKTARDSAGLATAFEFDALGRLTWELPAAGHDAYTEYEYVPAATNAPAMVLMKRRPNGQRTGAPLAEAEFLYDSLGRLWRERSLLADATWSLRQTGYDWLGRKSFVTEQVTDAGVEPGPRTTYVYDLFGRPTTITPPDGASHNETISYVGVREVTRTRKVATSAVAETSASTKEEYDRHGRLWKITENAGTADAVVTSYEYDAGSRLKSVTTTGSDGYAQPSRLFNYDGRGFLTSETHPESGTTNYTYNARGRVLAQDSPQYDLSFVYDRAERVSVVNQIGLGALKEFTYDRPNSGTDYSNGKLNTAVRHNRLAAALGGDNTVTETYTYQGRGGRVSSVKTEIREGGQVTQTFTDSTVYDQLGSRLSLSYPLCTGCSGVSQPSRSVTAVYSNGFLTSVPNYASSIKYHPNGLTSEIQHVNRDGSSGPLYKQTIASNGMARPDTISIEGACGVSFSSQPQSVTIQLGQSAPLSVTVNGATVVEWFNTGGTLVGSGASISVSPQVTTTYYARAGDGTCTRDSATATVTVESAQCPAPGAAVNAPSSVVASVLSSASTATVSGATYAWTISNGVIEGNATLPSVSFRAGCSGAVVLTVNVTASCGTVSTASKTISITPPTVTVNGSVQIASGQSTAISATLTGEGPWLVFWADETNPRIASSSTHNRTVSPTATTTYHVSFLYDGPGCEGTILGNGYTVTVTAPPPPAPTNLFATAVSANQVDLSWSFSGTKDRFEIDRSALNGSWVQNIGQTTTNAFSDMTAATNTAYLYRVRAVSGGASSSPSAVDLATTVIFADPTLVIGQTVARVQHVTQLRTAVNAVRALAGLSASAFTDTIVAGTSIRAVHIQELRTALNQARSTLLLTALTYTDNPLSAGMPIRAAHISQLRSGVEVK